MKSSRPCKLPKHQVVIPWRDHFLIFLQSRFMVSRRHCHAPSCLNQNQTSRTLLHLCCASTHWRTTSEEASRHWHPAHLEMLVGQGKGKKTTSPLLKVSTKWLAQPPGATLGPQEARGRAHVATDASDPEDASWAQTCWLCYHAKASCYDSFLVPWRAQAVSGTKLGRMSSIS